MVHGHQHGAPYARSGPGPESRLQAAAAAVSRMRVSGARSPCAAACLPAPHLAFPRRFLPPAPPSARLLRGLPLSRGRAGAASRSAPRHAAPRLPPRPTHTFPRSSGQDATGKGSAKAVTRARSLRSYDTSRIEARGPPTGRSEGRPMARRGFPCLVDDGNKLAR
jgi:hypothetical protein